MNRRVNIAFTFAVGLAEGGWPLTLPAQTPFPVKPVRLINPTTAGGQPDVISRMIAQRLAQLWGKPVLVDNRPSAGGIIAATLVAKAAPDGHTLLYAVPNFVIIPALQANLPYDPRKDFAGIAQVGFSTNTLVVSSSLGVKSVADLVALAKAQPGKLIYGSGASGTAGHLNGARFQLAAGIKVVHVAFKGGPDAVIEILAGRSHFTVTTMGLALPFIREGKLLGLAVTSPQRSPVLPDAPSLSESYAEFKQPETSHGVLAPAATPRAIIQQISLDLARVLNTAGMKAQLQAIAFTVAPTTPEEYDKLLGVQLESMAKLVVEAGLKAQ